MQRTLDAVETFARAIRESGGDIRAIATSAMRRADNAEDFARRVRETTGAELEILSGAEEARCSYVGAVAMLPRSSARYGVADTGGGSTEYATGTHGHVEREVSCEIGAVRLTEAVPELSGASRPPALDEARRIAREALAPLAAMPAVERLLLVGGTATTVIRVLRGRREDFNTAPLRRDALRSVVDRFAKLDRAERLSVEGLNPQRADIALAGGLILETIFAITGHDDALVSTTDILLGYLVRHDG